MVKVSSIAVTQEFSKDHKRRFVCPVCGRDYGGKDCVCEYCGYDPNEGKD